MIAAARPRRLFFGRAGFGGLGGFSRLARRGDSPRGVFSFAFFAGAGASGSSGGSDYHGLRKPDIALGSGRGGLRVPYAYLAGLKALAGHKCV